MTRAAIEQLLWSMDRAFAGGRANDYDEHGLVTNLGTLADHEWGVTPAGGMRSIADIVEHVGECKYMYENHAFGDASLTWDAVRRPRDEWTPEATMPWLREGHERLVASVVALADDEELLRPRPANWGEFLETRRLIAIMIEHDLYHAGEINHVRSLLHGEDRWAHVIER